jgi:hypothetical protein
MNMEYLFLGIMGFGLLLLIGAFSNKEKIGTSFKIRSIFVTLSVILLTAGLILYKVNKDKYQLIIFPMLLDSIATLYAVLYAFREHRNKEKEPRSTHKSTIHLKKKWLSLPKDKETDFLKGLDFDTDYICLMDAVMQNRFDRFIPSGDNFRIKGKVFKTKIERGDDGVIFETLPTQIWFNDSHCTTLPDTKRVFIAYPGIPIFKSMIERLKADKESENPMIILSLADCLTAEEIYTGASDNFYDRDIIVNVLNKYFRKETI